MYPMDLIRSAWGFWPANRYGWRVLRAVFDQEAEPGLAKLVPVVGSLGELLADSEVNYLVIDLNSPSGRLEALAEIRRSAPATSADCDWAGGQR